MSNQVIAPKPEQIIKPGPALVVGARVLQDPRGNVGVYPYQWLFPGPHSRQVLGNGTVPITGPGNTDQILSYQVPSGMKFSLRGIVCGYLGAGWTEGTNQLVFTLTVTAAGTRKVDFLQNVQTHLGSLESPYPILGRLEFEPLDVLAWSVTNTGGPAAGAANIAFAHLVGLTYPQSEAA